MGIPAMESTTLVTFMVQHLTARKIELLGSWDNFSTPYSMELDRRRGGGYWTGCHQFHDIICDGADIHEPRVGGLRMGGTYWYFYRIDGDEEFFNPSEETTAACPLMPGQTLNVLEVPYQDESPITHSRASSLSMASFVHTLNPQDRYVTPQPAAKPKKSRLVPSGQAAASARHLLAPPEAIGDRPWTAFPSGSHGRENRKRTADRQIKSAPYSPAHAISMFWNSLQHKSPPSAHTASESSRSRGRTLHHRRISSTRAMESREVTSGKANSRPPSCALLDEEDTPLATGLGTQDVPQWDSTRCLSPAPEKRRLRKSDQSNTIDGHSYLKEEGEFHELTQHPRAFSGSFSSSGSIPQRRCASSRLREFDFDLDHETALDVLEIPTTVPEIEFNGHYSIDSSWPEDNLESWGRAYPLPRTLSSGFARTGWSSDMGMDLQRELTPLPSLFLPEPVLIDDESDGMYLAHHALHDQYTSERQYSPWRPELEIPLPESPEHFNEDGGSEAFSPTFSSIPGDVSERATPFLLPQPETGHWPLTDDTNAFDAFDFQLEQPRKSFERLSVHTRGTGSTASTAMPYQLPNTNPFARSKESVLSLHPPAEQRQLSQMEQLLDEFEYLGAALL